SRTTEHTPPHPGAPPMRLLPAAALIVFTLAAPLAAQPAKVAADALPSVAVVGCGNSTGAAFAVSPATLVTCRHVAGAATRWTASLRAGTVLKAEVLARDKSLGRALLRVSGRQLACVRVARAAPPPVGARVVAVGHPFSYDWTVT